MPLHLQPIFSFSTREGGGMIVRRYYNYNYCYY